MMVILGYSVLDGNFKETEKIWKLNRQVIQAHFSIITNLVRKNRERGRETNKKILKKKIKIDLNYQLQSPI